MRSCSSPPTRPPWWTGNDARAGWRLFYLLDEVLQGTNSVERGAAVRAVAKHLLEAGAIGAMTTHDLALANEEPFSSRAVLVHFTEQLHADGRIDAAELARLHELLLHAQPDSSHTEGSEMPSHRDIVHLRDQVEALTAVVDQLLAERGKSSEL